MYICISCRLVVSGRRRSIQKKLSAPFIFLEYKFYILSYFVVAIFPTVVPMHAW